MEAFGNSRVAVTSWRVENFAKITSVSEKFELKVNFRRKKKLDREAQPTTTEPIIRTKMPSRNMEIFSERKLVWNTFL